MTREREKRNISPILARYLLSEDTRRRYLREYKISEITEQDDYERYYAFDAVSRDGRTKLRTDVFLSEASRPIFVRRRSTHSTFNGESRNIDVTSYSDLETVFQVKELLDMRHDSSGHYFKVYLFSVRSHLRKQRDGIHWIYDTDGEINSAEVYTDPASKITFSFLASPENCMTFLDDPDSPKTNYTADINHNNGNVLVVVKSEDGITITGECADKIDPFQYHLILNKDGRRWKNISTYNPTRFAFSETVKRDEGRSE